MLVSVRARVELDWEVRRILELRRRGLGVTEIAKRVYGDRRKRYRVWRLLKKLEQAGGVAGATWEGDDGHVAPGYTMQHEADDRPGGPTTEPGRAGRLGATQRIVLEVLEVSGPSTPSEIAAYALYEYGVRLTRNAVWHALKRLVSRGLAERLPGGRYRVKPHSSGVLVENLRVRGRIVWSTREHGRPAPLEDATMLAALRGRTWPVDQAELSILVGGGARRKAEQLHRAGWRMTVIYLNPRQGLKVEHRFWNPPYPFRPEARQDWITLAREATSLAAQAALQASMLLPRGP